VAIAPGPAETFGLAGLEALACGTPVVVSAESALPEVVGEAGASVAGEDLAAGVTTVLSWPEPTRRAAARARAEHFGWPAAVRAFLAIHEALVADEAGRGDRLAADITRQGDRLAADETDLARQRDRLAADEAEGRGQVGGGVAARAGAGASAGTGVRTERRLT
jgi:hypothetical protein